jgi:hypothetical protein
VYHSKLNLPLQLAWTKIIICIQVLQPLPAREFQETVTRRIASMVRTRLPMDAIAKLPDNIQTAIRRTIVNHDDFLIGPRLRQGAFDRLGDPSLGVVAGDQD